MGKKWSKEDIDLLKKEFPNCKSIKELAEKLKKTIRAIRAMSKKINLYRIGTNRDYNRIWTLQENNFLIENYSFGNVNEIAKSLNRTKKAITERAKILKIKRDSETSINLNRKNSININFFKSWSDNMAYVLGLICTDGNLSKTSHNVIISLKNNDEYLLKNISKAMNSSYKVVREKRDNGNMSKFSFENKFIYNDLINLKLTPKKSLTLKCPDVPFEFIASFIRGVMDGDGSVSGKSKRMKISSASRYFIDGISDMLEKIGVKHKIYNNSYAYKDCTRDFFNLVVLRKDSLKRLYNLMYTGAELFLLRKKQEFDKMRINEEDFEIKCKISMKKVIGVNKNNNSIIFNSLMEAKQNGFKSINRALKTKKEYKGYIWKYL